MRTLLIAGLLVCTACMTEAEEFHDDEAEPIDTGDNLLEQGLVDCSETAAVGYRSGERFDITLIHVDGKPTERDTANAYAVMQAAAARDGVSIRIVSGFRTNEEQQHLYTCYRECSCNNCNVAARPGYSNHQSGHALDLNTNSPGVLSWLNAHGGDFGFRRTVPSEAWHWEWWGGGPGGGPCGTVAQEEPQRLTGTRVSVAAHPSGDGYWIAARDGAVYAFGDARYLGGANSSPLSRPIVGIAAARDGNGYWLVASDGGVFAFGNAGFFGSLGNITLNKPVVGMAVTPSGNGYWLVASDGGVFAFGDAGFHGSAGDIALNQPVVGMAATPSGNGYWLVASDGGIFSYGDAAFHGSMGGTALNKPVVGIASTADGRGYWMVASDGGIFAFGNAAFQGSTGSMQLNQPVVGMAATPSGDGYWLVAADGGLFSFGGAGFHGSAANL